MGDLLMGVRLVNANCVVVAKAFNLTLVNQVWLVRHGLIGEHEYGQDWAFTSVFAQVVTEKMDLIVSPDRLQLRPKVPEGEQQALVMEKVGKFVSLLPHTPYVAVGLNFDYQLLPEKGDTAALTRSMFFNSGSALHRFFDTPDARFGGYLSKDELGCRLRLDVKPALAQLVGEEKAQHCVVMAFNFHHDLETEPDPVGRITATIAKWDEAKRLSRGIVQAVAEGTSL